MPRERRLVPPLILRQSVIAGGQGAEYDDLAAIGRTAVALQLRAAAS